MKTVIHTTIDGFDVVLGFSDPQMDPVATAARVDPLVQALPEMKGAEDLGKRIGEAQAALAYAGKQIAIARANGNQVALTSQQQAYAQASADLESLQAELVPVLAAIDAKKQSLIAANPVWFTPGHSVGADGVTVREDLLPETDAEYHGEVMSRVTYATLRSAVRNDPHLQLLIDGTPIADYRGSVVWSKSSGRWEKRVISKLGDKPAPNEFDEADLTPAERDEVAAQLEVERVAALTDAQKLGEAQGAQAAAKAAAVQVQSEVRLGISAQDALTAAVAAYKTELAAINAKYGTSLS